MSFRSKVLLAVLAAAGVAAAVAVFVVSPGAGEGSRVRIYAGGAEYAVVSLKEDLTVTVPGPLGTTTVQVRSGRVRVLDSPCPRGICVSRGWVKAPGENVTCLPNEVFIEVIE